MNLTDIWVNEDKFELSVVIFFLCEKHIFQTKSFKEPLEYVATKVTK